MNANIINAIKDAYNCGQITQETYDNLMIKFSDETIQTNLFATVEYAKKVTSIKTVRFYMISVHIFSMFATAVILFN